MADNIISMYERSNNPRHDSPKECLERLLKAIDTGGKIDKLIVITVDDSEQDFTLSVRSAGVAGVESVALLEYAKASLIGGYNEGEEDD